MYQIYFSAFNQGGHFMFNVDVIFVISISLLLFCLDVFVYNWFFFPVLFCILTLEIKIKTFIKKNTSDLA